ncbi:hypothetical protein ACWEVD_24920 [Nocardia thailandica]|uniref:Uncharacterized protein n=1 Tax=Nocardia thailandica TaxID=257275 RepID=A0ABW6PTC0_9NOCA|nr:hypothetical protein [Nocardia thailandica]
MNKLIVSACAVAAFGLAAAPAQAAGLPLEPAGEQVVAIAPETGSGAIYNGIMCQLHTLSASVPCMYT